MSAADSSLASLHAVVTGRVQGVFFRAFVRQHARALGITGSVRNIRYAGAVEVEAEGERSRLEQLLQQLYRGPSEARVDDVQVEWGEYTGRFSRFDITY